MLDVGTPDAQILVVGVSGVIHLPAGQGKWWLPEGTYHSWSVRLRHKEEGADTTWTLENVSNTRDLQEFEVASGKTVSKQVGGLLTKGGPGAGGVVGGPGSIKPGDVVVDRAGIEYKPVERDGQAIAEPPPVLASMQNEARLQRKARSARTRPMIVYTYTRPMLRASGFG